MGVTTIYHNGIEHVTIRYAADLLGVSRQRIHQIIAEYSLPTAEFEYGKLIRRKDLESIAATDRRNGVRRNPQNQRKRS